MAEIITEQLNNLTIKSKSKVLYYSLSIIDNEEILKLITDHLPNAKLIKYNDSKIDDSIQINHNILIRLKDSGYIIYLNHNIYKLNSEFHITMLFIKGHPDEEQLINKLDGLIDNDYQIIIDKIAVSDEYIVFGAILPDELKSVYGGNPIIHITCGSILYDNPKRKSPPPVNSPSAFGKSIVGINDIIINSKLIAVNK